MTRHAGCAGGGNERASRRSTSSQCRRRSYRQYDAMRLTHVGDSSPSLSLNCVRLSFVRRSTEFRGSMGRVLNTPPMRGDPPRLGVGALTDISEPTSDTSLSVVPSSQRRGRAGNNTSRVWEWTVHEIIASQWTWAARRACQHVATALEMVLTLFTGVLRASILPRASPFPQVAPVAGFGLRWRGSHRARRACSSGGCSGGVR